MGCCYNVSNLDQEFISITSIEELERYLTKKTVSFQLEIEQIKSHLKDPNTSVDYIDITNMTDEHLHKRIGFLDELKNTYIKIVELLKGKEHLLKIEEVKIKLNNVIDKYLNIYDPNNELEEYYEEFENYVKQTVQ